MTFTNLFNNTIGRVNQQGVGSDTATKLNNKMVSNLNTPATISNDDYDHILRIVDIFKQAYRLYAKDVIPSGRPGGRVSQSVFREYEYIGTSNSGVPEWKEESNPGYGPWADKLVFNKWEDEVMKILQDPKLRKVLANTKFKSVAEKDTNTEQKEKPGSGVTLMSFIEELLNGKGDFKDIRSKLMKKYFNIGGGDDKNSSSSGYKSNSSSSLNSSSKSNTTSGSGKKLSVKWVGLNQKESLKVGHFYKLKYDYDNGNEKDKPLNFYVLSLDMNEKKIVVISNGESDDYSSFYKLGLDKNYDISTLRNKGNSSMRGISLSSTDTKSFSKMLISKNREWDGSTTPGNIDPQNTRTGLVNLKDIKILVDENDQPVNLKYDFSKPTINNVDQGRLNWMKGQIK